MPHRTHASPPTPGPDRELYRARSGPISWSVWQADASSRRQRQQIQLLALIVAELIPNDYRLNPKGSRDAINRLLASGEIAQIITDLNTLPENLRPATSLTPLGILAFCLRIEGALLTAQRR